MFGTLLNPMLAAGAMSLSSLFVVGNSLTGCTATRKVGDGDFACLALTKTQRLLAAACACMLEESHLFGGDEMSTVYRVTGMTCTGCANALRNAIKAVAPDAAVEVDLEANHVAIAGYDNVVVIASAVEDAGFGFEGPA